MHNSAHLTTSSPFPVAPSRQRWARAASGNRQVGPTSQLLCTRAQVTEPPTCGVPVVSSSVHLGIESVADARNPAMAVAGDLGVLPSPPTNCPRRGLLPLRYKCTHQSPPSSWSSTVGYERSIVRNRSAVVEVAHTPPSGSRSRVWEHHQASLRLYRGHRGSGHCGFALNRSP